MATIHLDLTTKTGDKKNSKVQSVPFYIHADVDANVNKYFESLVKQKDDCFTTSFRGYPLNGINFTLPNDYVGLVFHESMQPITEKQERIFYEVNKFEKLRYWNWDKLPTDNDLFKQAVDWIEISEALHTPILD